jgi:hypothetical protein
VNAPRVTDLVQQFLNIETSEDVTREKRLMRVGGARRAAHRASSSPRRKRFNLPRPQIAFSSIFLFRMSVDCIPIAIVFHL